MLKCLLLSIFLFTTISIYSLTIQDSEGNEVNLNDYRGKKILFVNVASQSRYVDQLGNLEKLQEKYKDSLVIIAVPSNSFGNEPDSGIAIRNLIKDHYGGQYIVTNAMKVAGPSASPVYKWLSSLDENGVMNSQVEGDFQKYLVSSDGRLIGYFVPGIDPVDSIILNAIEDRVPQ